ncbi:bifunctional protein GlmU [Campylobacterota bacterium]|nr:bifunctional protein GlmU [Campylobacterota bacterium]
MRNISVVILAAGAGTRMKSPTPKVLHRLAGREMIDFAIRAALSVSSDVRVVLFHEFDLIAAHIGAEFGESGEFGGRVRCVRQDHLRFPGTGGAAMAGIEGDCGDRIVVLNGDMPLITPEFVKILSEKEEAIAISVFELEDPSGYGRVIIRENRVEKIVEEKDASEAEKSVNIVNAGVYSFSREFLTSFLPQLQNNNAQKEYYITDLIAIAAANGIPIGAVKGDRATLMGINSKSDLANAEKIYEDNLKKQLMNSGVIMRMPETIFIDDRAVFEGECILENGVVISGACKIKNSHIKTYSVIEESVIIESDIGPMAHIRPQSQIVKTHIGNFVETKNAKLNGVKAGHLSYLGDAEIGENTNIGAGTITCNYDGKKKHKTTIGKDVFIGSDTQLVAPVTIPDNVIIGAGTTVTKSCESGDLVLSRTEQKNIAGFFARFFGKTC